MKVRIQISTLEIGRGVILTLTRFLVVHLESKLGEQDL